MHDTPTNDTYNPPQELSHSRFSFGCSLGPFLDISSDQGAPQNHAFEWTSQAQLVLWLQHGRERGGWRPGSIF